MCASVRPRFWRWFLINGQICFPPRPWAWLCIWSHNSALNGSEKLISQNAFWRKGNYQHKLESVYILNPNWPKPLVFKLLGSICCPAVHHILYKPFHFLFAPLWTHMKYPLICHVAHRAARCNRSHLSMAILYGYHTCTMGPFRWPDTDGHGMGSYHENTMDNGIVRPLMVLPCPTSELLVGCQTLTTKIPHPFSLITLTTPVSNGTTMWRGKTVGTLVLSFLSFFFLILNRLQIAARREQCHVSTLNTVHVKPQFLTIPFVPADVPAHPHPMNTIECPLDPPSSSGFAGYHDRKGGISAIKIKSDATGNVGMGSHFRDHSQFQCPCSSPCPMRPLRLIFISTASTLPSFAASCIMFSWLSM